MNQHPMGEGPSVPLDSQSHRSTLALLPEYVTMLVLGQQPPPEWAPLEQHLASCAACRAEAESLREQLAEVYAGTLPEAPAPPPPNLSFLRRPQNRKAAPGRQANRAPKPAPASAPLFTLQFSTALLAAMQVRVAARAGEMRLRYAYTFPTLKESDPTITLELLAADDQTERGVARICVELSERDPFDQAGTTVTLRSGELVFQAITDQGGAVVFSDVDLSTVDSWQISIAPPEG